MRLWRRREEDLDDEIRDYIDRETQENIQAGMPEGEARLAAKRKFGRVLFMKEETREVWGWIWLERLWQDLRHGIRLLAKDPGFTAVAVLSLAIGIGANSAIFSVADATLLRPLPVSHPNQIVTLVSRSPNGRTGVSYRDYVDIRDHSRSFDGLVAFTEILCGFSAHTAALPHMKLGMLVTGNFFQVMGVEPDLGRGFRPEEDRTPGRDAVVVISRDLWEKQFGGDPSAIGRAVRLNGIEFTVIGVAPARFTGMDQYMRPAFYVPLMMSARLAGEVEGALLEARDRREFTVKGRLRPGVPIEQARAEVAVIAKALERAYPVTNRNFRVVAGTEFQTRVDRSPPDAMLVGMLAALAAAVLLVACANVASLLLCRARVRAREIALRVAIGAGRLRLIRQLLTESLLIAVAGGGLGLAIGYAGVAFLKRIQMPTDLPVVIAIQLDRRALLFSLAASLLSAILFGLAPAIHTTGADMVDALKTGGTDGPGRRRLWGRNLLVVGQVAVSLVLLAAATMLFRGMRDYMRTGPGCRTDHLLMMSFNPALVGYSEAQTRQFYRQLTERARAVPGVKSVALASVIPMGTETNSITVIPEGYQFPPGKESVTLDFATVDENYFGTLDVPLVRGRGFRATDSAAAPRVAVVNEEFAKLYWPGQDAVGKRFRVDDRNGPWVEIVGVAKTGKYQWIAEPPTPYLYVPLAQRPRMQMTLLAESSGNPADLAGPLREVVRSLDANQPLYDVRPFEDFYQKRAVSTPNTIIETVGAMGLMGLALAMVGLYGLVAYAAGTRTREIGIRIAVGARRPAVLRMIMRQGLVLGLTGIAIGLVAAFGAEKLLMAVFSGTERDFVSYLLVAPALLTVTVFAAYIPARRAANLDPVKALRCE